MRKLFSVFMIIIGSFLEIYFYVWRFSQDGLILPLSITIGAGLTLLLTILIYHRQYKWAVAIIIPLALYSIFATSAGQAFSLNEKSGEEEQKQVKSTYITEQIEEKKREITEIDVEINTINELLKNSVEDIEKLGTWRSTVRESWVHVDDLRATRENFRNQLAGLISQATAHSEVAVRPKNIYTFYSDMLSFPEYWLQFILQTLLSAFIAIMAPIGLITYNKKQLNPISAIKLLTPEYIEKWVNINWISCRSGKQNKILSKKLYRKHLENHNVAYDKEKYDIIHNLCCQKEIIHKNGNIIITEEERAIKILKKEISK